MSLDRDLGVSVVRAWAGARDRTGWEVTAATGIRGLRLLRETAAFRQFRFTERNPATFEVLSENCATAAGAIADPHDGQIRPADAPFDYVDIDPYGSPIPFVPTAIDAVRPGGLLAVTATDMMVLAGAQPAAAIRRYGGRPVRGRLGPEGGLRILLAYLSRTAVRAHRSIRPRVSYVHGHYVRAYLSVEAASGEAPPVAEIDPASWDGPPLGPGGPFGPLWIGPLSDPESVAQLEVPPSAENRRELEALLRTLREEAAIRRPFYYEPNEVARSLRLSAPPALDELITALRQQGYATARGHARAGSFRTDAPRPVVEQTARVFVSTTSAPDPRGREGPERR